VVMVSFTTYSILKFNVMNLRFFAVNVGVVLTYYYWCTTSIF
jgi:hypothetical protein